MKKFIYFSLITCLLTLTSCINIIEELFINKDGSGKYQITIDMSEVMAGGGLRDMMKQFGGEDAENPDNPFSGDGPVEVDTVMYMKDAPDSIRTAFGNDALLEKITIHQLISESKEQMKTEFLINFEQISEVQEFLNKLETLQGNDSPMPGGGGLLPSGNGKLKLFDLAKKRLTRFPSPKPEQEMGDEEMGMMKMMLADATYKTIYYLPGKVKSTTMENAVIEGNKVTLEVPAIQAIEGKAKLEGQIKFKKK